MSGLFGWQSDSDAVPSVPCPGYGIDSRRADTAPASLAAVGASISALTNRRRRLRARMSALIRQASPLPPGSQAGRTLTTAGLPDHHRVTQTTAGSPRPPPVPVSQTTTESPRQPPGSPRPPPGSPRPPPGSPGHRRVTQTTTGHLTTTGVIQTTNGVT